MYSNLKLLFAFITFINVVCGNVTELHTDLNFCKLSHLGLEYKGVQFKTESGVRCQSWQTDNPIHKVEENFPDDKFPYYLKKLSKNYCRNPNKDPKGPWCYTMDANLINETCNLPICTYTDCKVTGPGIEYAGIHSKGTSERNCLKWNKARKKVKYKNEFIKIEKFSNDRFPDEDIQEAKKLCRNPDGNIGGPWCFVEHEETREIEKEYCDIPFCDIFESLVFSQYYPVYSHYFSFKPSEANFTFGLKLWDSDSYFDANARLVLSLFALPLNQTHIHKSEFAIEISISNRNSSLSAGYKSGLEYEPSVGVLKASEFTFFSLSWSSGFITLQKEGELKPIFLNEFKLKNNLMGLLKDRFYFYTFQGTNMLWTFPFANSESCTVHTTTTSVYQNFLPLRETEVGLDLVCHVRVTHSANILLVTNPPANYPQIAITLSNVHGRTTVVAVEYEGGPKVVLKDIELRALLGYWVWNEFTVSIFSDTLSLSSRKDGNNHLLFEVKHNIIKAMRWFSPSSNNNVGHWTFHCKPPKSADPPNALPPECALDKQESDYKGHQAITNKGLPCLPWSSKLVPDQEVESFFPNKTILQAHNYCRNPKTDPGGSYCYAVDQNPNILFTKTSCVIRSCKSSECKMAGTGNDYVGKLNTTRSNRTCINWAEFLTNNTMYEQYSNSTLYPDVKLEDAGNFCRNPSRSIGGSWCFVNDSYLDKDICNVRDCDKPEECTIVVRELVEGRLVYILPEWKEKGIHGGLRFSLKQWDPDLLEGLAVQIRGFDPSDIMTLQIGAEYNEKIILHYRSELMKQKTFVHLLPSGRWASFWLQMRKGEIMLGYEGVPEPFFDWQHEEPEKAFQPVFFGYNPIYAHPIGLYFDCESCHLEITTSSSPSKLMSVGIWSTTENDIYSNLTLYIRGNGTAVIYLYAFPESESFEIELNNSKEKVGFYKNKSLVFYNSVMSSLYTLNTWTKITISFSEHNINVTRNGSGIMLYEYRQLTLNYWFSVGSKDGSITWSANCDPPDIDGRPTDGGWSHWSGWHCTVTCGGGEGYRTRTCSNPKPNVFGNLCEGSPTSTGICNTFECGDISPDTLDRIRESLQNENNSLIVREHDSVIIHNNKVLLDIINKESPESYYVWILNGLPVLYKNDRIEFKFENIYINGAELSDIGIYVCVLHRINKQKIIIRVVSLAVSTDRNLITTRATLDIRLKSNAVLLAFVYSDLNQKWLLNDTVYVDYGTTTLAAVSSIHLKSLNMSNSGLWKCVVEQSDLNLKWVTNIVKVLVKRAPNMYTHLREDELTAPFFSWISTDQGVFAVIVGIVVFVCLLVALVVYLYFKYCTLPMSISQNRRKYNLVRQTDNE